MESGGVPRFNEEKAVAVATQFLKLGGGKCDKYWLNKVMYYVERQSLVEIGQPIFYDLLYSAPYGPIVSAVNDGIDMAEYPFGFSWDIHLALEGKTVILKEEGDFSLLSAYECNLIDETYKKFRGWEFNKLKNYFHKMPEHKETNSRLDIHYDEILEAEGFEPETIRETLEEISYFVQLENILDPGN